MPAPKKPKRPPVDVDAMLAETDIPDPEPVVLRWRGRDWRLHHFATMPGDLVAGAIEGDLPSVLRLLGKASIGPVDGKSGEFPVPSMQQAPTVMQAWIEAGGETAEPGE